MREQARFASTESKLVRDLRRGSIFLRYNKYMEVRNLRPAGHGRSAKGGYELKLRELDTRKPRELKFPEKARVTAVECDVVERVVMYQNHDIGMFVLADDEYNEVWMPLMQVGEVADEMDAGTKVKLLYHDGNIVKLVPPRQIADRLRMQQRRDRRKELNSRQIERHGRLGAYRTRPPRRRTRF